jgi:hypothetical protein
MEHPGVVAGITVAALVVLSLVVVLILSGGQLQRVMLARRAGLRILRDGDFAAKIDTLLNPPPPEPARPAKPDPAPIRLLTVLQREGRLVDFLLENLAGASDQQIAAGVREIHRKCQKALQEHLDLVPVLPEGEDEPVDVPAGFDPSAVQLLGNVTGQPPFKGKVQHPGWRVKEIRLTKAAEGVDELVVQPAEVELP